MKSGDSSGSGVQRSRTRGLVRAAACVSLLGLAAPGAAGAGEPVRVGGTGAALGAVSRLGEQAAASQPDLRIEVMASLGSRGGARAIADNAIDIAVLQRPPTPAERESGLREGACATTPFVFVSSRPQPAGLTARQIPSLFSDIAPTWPDGSPLRIILRSRDGSSLQALTRSIPGIEEAFAAASTRRGVPVGVTDQENADLAQRTQGSLATMTLLQLRSEKLPLHALALDGVHPETDARYPMRVRLCLVLRASPRPEAARFIAHVRSPAGQALLRELGAEPAD